MPHPDVGVGIMSYVRFTVDGHRLQSACDNVLAAFWKTQTGPVFPLADAALDGHRLRHNLQLFRTESLMHPHPRIKRHSIRSFPANIPFHRCQRVETLECWPNRCNQIVQVVVARN